jgi:hypothetical protein
VRMRILQLVEIGVLRSSHAQSHGTACFSGSVRPASPTTYLERIPELISRNRTSRLLFSYSRHLMGCLPDSPWLPKAGTPPIAY